MRKYVYDRLVNIVGKWENNVCKRFLSLGSVQPFPKQQILYPSKLKEFADYNFKFDGKFPKRIENTVEKGEIACYEQFFLFLQCFQKTCTADT